MWFKSVLKNVLLNIKANFHQKCFGMKKIQQQFLISTLSSHGHPVPELQKIFFIIATSLFYSVAKQLY